MASLAYSTHLHGQITLNYQGPENQIPRDVGIWFNQQMGDDPDHYEGSDIAIFKLENWDGQTITREVPLDINLVERIEHVAKADFDLTCMDNEPCPNIGQEDSETPFSPTFNIIFEEHTYVRIPQDQIPLGGSTSESRVQNAFSLFLTLTHNPASEQDPFKEPYICTSRLESQIFEMDTLSSEERFIVSG